MIMSATLPPRRLWLRCLAAVERKDLAEVAAAVRSRYAVRARSLPQAGLAMLQMVEPNRGHRFHLGELPLASAAVELIDEHGERHPGAAQLMHDDESVAVDAAICDAALAAGLAGSDRISALIAEGASRLSTEDFIRAGLLRSTTVAFDLLEEANDEDD
jgi:phosphonate C-P lyase system protein PhnG